MVDKILMSTCLYFPEVFTGLTCRMIDIVAVVTAKGSMENMELSKIRIHFYLV